MVEFEDARNQGLVGWGGKEGILEKEVDNYPETDNYGPEEEKKSNNGVEESQLTCLQYKLTQGNGKYGNGDAQKIIDQDMPGMRTDIPKGETNNCYGGAARRVEINDMGGRNTFIRVLGGGCS